MLQPQSWLSEPRTERNGAQRSGAEWSGISDPASGCRGDCFWARARGPLTPLAKPRSVRGSDEPALLPDDLDRRVRHDEPLDRQERGKRDHSVPTVVGDLDVPDPDRAPAERRVDRQP